MSKWSEEEIRRLVLLVAQNNHKLNSWVVIGELLGRRPKQCRELWHNKLDPRINRQEWTEKDYQLVVQWYPCFGTRWARYQHKVMTDRSQNDIKNHFYSSLRRAARLVAKKLHKLVRPDAPSAPLDRYCLQLLYSGQFTDSDSQSTATSNSTSSTVNRRGRKRKRTDIEPKEPMNVQDEKSKEPTGPVKSIKLEDNGSKESIEPVKSMKLQDTRSKESIEPRVSNDDTVDLQKLTTFVSTILIHSINAPLLLKVHMLLASSKIDPFSLVEPNNNQNVDRTVFRDSDSPSAMLSIND